MVLVLGGGKRMVARGDRWIPLCRAKNMLLLACGLVGKQTDVAKSDHVHAVTLLRSTRAVDMWPLFGTLGISLLVKGNELITEISAAFSCTWL